MSYPVGHLPGLLHTDIAVVLRSVKRGMILPQSPPAGRKAMLAGPT